MSKIQSTITFFLCFMFFTYSQTKLISGQIINKTNNQPLADVTVSVEGTSDIAISDSQGKYSIEALESAELIFELDGFKKIILKLTENPNTSVVFLEDERSQQEQKLEEVVVMGSTVRVTRKELGNAVTSLKAGNLLKAQPTGVTSALQGKIPGAQITQNSGDPSGGFSIKLRGTSSILGSSDPLYVIDGVVINNATTNVTNLNVTASGGTSTQIGQNRSSDINPNDIETIEVLNGGAAAAIYGSRAANGVILITTKKGTSGQTKYTFSSTISVNSLRKKLDVNRTKEQFVTNKRINPTTGREEAFIGSEILYPIRDLDTRNVKWTSPNYDINNPNSSTSIYAGFRTLERAKIGVERYDYQDDIFTTGIGSDNYFSMRGGNEKTRYFASLGYLYNEGIIKNTDFQRFGGKIRIHHDVSEKLTASVGINYINSQSNEKPDGNVFWSPINSINITNNIYDINKRDANGRLLPVDAGRINPISIIEDIKLSQKTDRIISDLQFNYKPIKNLNIDLIFGLDTYNQRGKNYIPRYNYAVNPAFYDDGYVSQANNQLTQLNNDLNIRYLWEVNPNLKLTTYAGYNLQSYRSDFNSIEGRNLSPFVESINSFSTFIGSGASQPRYNLWGYYIQETLGYRNKLFFTGALRLDASSIFSKENRTQLYPKLSGSYVLSEEKFMKNINNIISSARIRGSWGESGSLTAIQPYARFTNYVPGSLGNALTFTLDNLRVGNINVKPEKSSTYEIGTDLSFLKDRLNLTFSYYNADIKDLLVPVEKAPSSGTMSQIENVGNMNNKGIELGINYTILKKTDLTIDAFFNFSKNKNKVTKLPQPFFKLENNRADAPIYIFEGMPIGMFYGTYIARDNNGNMLLRDGLDINGNPIPGTAVPYTQRGPNNPDGSNGPLLNKIIGDPNPDFIYSFGMNVNYKKFGLSILLDGVSGGDIFDADYRTRQGVGQGNIIEKELKGELPRGYMASIYDAQEFRIVDGSYLKLREVSANYSFGKIKNTFSDLTITLSGRNLYSWDKYTSYDPEVNAGGQSSIAKYNFGTVPIPRTFAISVKAQF